MTTTDTLAKELAEIAKRMLPFVISDGVGGCTGQYWETCPHCAIIHDAKVTLARYDSATKDQQDER